MKSKDKNICYIIIFTQYRLDYLVRELYIHLSEKL